jgi:hypothetical protein
MPAGLLTLPPDPVALLEALRESIRLVLTRVEGLGQIHPRPRYPSGDTEDVALSTVPDPIVGETRPFTNVLQIGFPTVTTQPYSAQDNKVQLTFDFPITFDLGVVDEWADPTSRLPYRSSAEMFDALFMLALREFAKVRHLGYKNVEHQHLQRDGAGDVIDENEEAQNHSGDWGLTVIVTDVTL